MKFTFPPESRPLEGYTIKRAIHRGGFGEVYYALSDAGKEVALKLLQRHTLDIELRGVSQCLNLKHPNLVTIFDVRTDGDGDHWVVMEYVSGKSLDRVIDEYPQGLPMEQVRHWLAGIVAGVEYLHDCGLVHRDLKPANIYTEHGSVKIGDVGLSKFIAPSQRSAQTQSVGTVYYMAPEVAHGRYGKEVDVYALAVILYEMLTGRVPFEGETTGEILMKHLSEEPDLTPLPAPLRPVLARALQKDPNLRTASAADLEKEFNAAVVGASGAVDIPDGAFLPPQGPVQRGSRPNTRPQPERRGRPLQETVEYQPQNPNAGGRAGGGPKKPQPGPKPAEKVKAKSAGKKSDKSDEIWDMVRTGAVVILLLAIYSPRTLGAAAGAMVGVAEIGILALLGYGLYRMYGSLYKTPQAIAQPPVNRPPATPTAPNTPPQPTAEQRAQAAPVHQADRTKRLYQRKTAGPNSLRPITWRHRLTDLSGALTAAVLSTAVITGGLALVGSGMFAVSASSADPHPVNVALFGLVTLLGAWTVLALSKFWEGTAVPSNVRRLSLLGAGAVVGMAAYGLNQFLMVDLPNNYFGRPYGVFQHVGSQALISDGTQPTLAGYMVFFGALFALRRWWHQADGFRKKRFRISSLLLTVLLANVLSAVWTFPVMWAMIWAAAISSVVQLSAVWVPVEHRTTLVEEAGQRRT